MSNAFKENLKNKKNDNQFNSKNSLCKKNLNQKPEEPRKTQAPKTKIFYIGDNKIDENDGKSNVLDFSKK